MPRRKRTELDHDLLYGRWTIFGEWLTLQRLLRGLTQNQAAKAIGISRHQWLRYELGARVPKKRMEPMANVLNIDLEKMLDRAGLKVSSKRNAMKNRIGRIYDLLCAGRLEFAMLELLRLDDRVTGTKSAVGPRWGGLEATDFSNAVMVINRLPRWRLEIILKLLQERIKDKKDKYEYQVKPDRKNLIRKKRKDVIHWT